MITNAISPNKGATGLRKDASPGSGKGTILVLDEKVEIRVVLAAMLTRSGYCVTLSRNGDEALAYFNKAKEQGNSYTAVILNLHSSAGMSGIAVMSALLVIDPHVRGILMTADLTHPAVVEHRELGFMTVLTKPFTMEKLLEVLCFLDQGARARSRKNEAGDIGQQRCFSLRASRDICFCSGTKTIMSAA